MSRPVPKKHLAKQKTEDKLTGGGPSTSVQEDETAAVASIIPSQIDSLNSSLTTIIMNQVRQCDRT